jgi:hypothetical protein
VQILDSFVPELLVRNRNRVQIEVSGFGSDPRELYDVPEVRSYFILLFERYPGLFFWIDASSYMFLFLGLMLFEPWRTNGKVGLRPPDLKSYVTYGFTGLNTFCKQTGVSPDATNAAVIAQLHTICG